MSNIAFTADGSILKNNRIIESMTDTQPLDYFNLAGNLKLSGSIRATNFYKEDGTEIQSVTVNKLALPENVYYVDKKMGINETNPTADLDVKGTGRVQGNFDISGNFVSKGPGTFKSTLTVEDEFVANKNAGVRGNFGVDGNFGTQGTGTFKGLLTADNNFVANKNATIGGNFSAQGPGSFKNTLTVEDEFVANKNATIGGNFITTGSGTFKGLVIVDNDFVANRNTTIGGNFGTTGTGTFKGLLTSDNDFVANKNASIVGNLNTQGISNFRGKVNAEDDFQAYKNANISGNFGTQGTATFKNLVYAESGFNLNGIQKIGAPITDANGEQLTIGNTSESHLRLGRHTDYSWIQSHGGKPLKINPLGNDICLQDVCLNSTDIKNLKNGSTSSTSATPTGNGLLTITGIKSDNNTQGVTTLDINAITDDMNILTILPVIGNGAQAKASVYFNIKLKSPAPTAPAKFTVFSDDGIIYEYSNSNPTPYLITPTEYTGFSYNLMPTPGVVSDFRGWKGQGSTPYDYIIPNTSTTGIIKCKLTWYNGEKGSTFQIKGLKAAITALGTLY